MCVRFGEICVIAASPLLSIGRNDCTSDVPRISNDSSIVIMHSKNYSFQISHKMRQFFLLIKRNKTISLYERWPGRVHRHVYEEYAFDWQWLIEIGIRIRSMYSENENVIIPFFVAVDNWPYRILWLPFVDLSSRCIIFNRTMTLLQLTDFRWCVSRFVIKLQRKSLNTVPHCHTYFRTITDL